MKKIIPFLGLVSLCSSCEEVVDLDLKDYEKKLVIDANIFVGEENHNAVKLYYSAPFYSNSYEFINTATVVISSEDGSETYDFPYQGHGKYTHDTFTPTMGKNYQLSVTVNGETYTATSQYWTLEDNIQVTITPNQGIMEEDYEIKFSYQDDVVTEDYYFHELNFDYSVVDDQFSNGQMMNKYFFIAPEDTDTWVKFAATKISKNYYDYLNKLFQSSANLGNPFASPIGRVNGNIRALNPTTEAPLGYFHIAKRKIEDFRISDRL